jgi:hypothetical protein
MQCVSLKNDNSNLTARLHSAEAAAAAAAASSAEAAENAMLEVKRAKEEAVAAAEESKRLKVQVQELLQQVLLPQHITIIPENQRNFFNGFRLTLDLVMAG